MTRSSCIVLLVAFALACVLAQEKSSDHYSDIDVKGILTNPKLRSQYYRCIVDKAPCSTASQKFFKESFGSALSNQCKNCTEKQKEHFEFVIEWYTKNEPAEWEEIITKVLEDARKAKA
ncbi:CspE4 [Eciton burchellii]|nr:CspE4 [Eciton burchellii]